MFDSINERTHISFPVRECCLSDSRNRNLIGLHNKNESFSEEINIDLRTAFKVELMELVK